VFGRVSRKKQHLTNLTVDNVVLQTIVEEQEVEIDALKNEVALLLEAVKTKVEETASFEIGAIFERERILDYLMTKKIIYLDKEGHLIATSKNLYETSLADLEP